MRRSIIVWVGSAVVAVAGTMACGGPQPTTLVSIGVAGRANSTPSVAAAGSFVAVAWGASVEGATDVFVAVSRDAGQTFATPVQVNTVPGAAKLGGEFPPRVAVTTGDGSGDPEIVVLWTEKGVTTAIKTARSRDGGATFDAPAALQALDAPGQRGWPALAMDGAGTAHTIWLDHRGMAAPAGEAATGAKHAGHQASDVYDGVAMAQKSGLYYASAGAPATGERELAKGVCYCCKTALTVASDGAVYAAWRHVYAGNLRDIAATVSRDGGRTFSEPVRISEDGWEIAGCPDDGPALAADGKGTVHVIWPTVIDGPSPEGALFYSFTSDGVTFAPRTRIPTLGSSRPTHPQIAVDENGRVMVAWDEFTGGLRMAAAREVRHAGSPTVDFGPVVMFDPSGPSTYPVLAGTSAGILGVWSTGGDTPAIAAKTIPWQ